MNNEEWKSIPGYEGLYEVSNKGRVRSVDRFVAHSKGGQRNMKGQLLKSIIGSHGYPVASLSKNGKIKPCLVHRLVATTFLLNETSHPEVNHLDGCKTNNDVNNLEWCTYTHNARHAYSTGLRAPADTRGSKNGMAKLTEDDVRDIKCRLANGETGRSIAKLYGMGADTISLIKHGKTWAHV